MCQFYESQMDTQGYVKVGRGVSVHPFYLPVCPVDHDSSHAHILALGEGEIEEGKLAAKSWGGGGGVLGKGCRVSSASSVGHLVSSNSTGNFIQ